MQENCMISHFSNMPPMKHKNLMCLTKNNLGGVGYRSSITSDCVFSLLILKFSDLRSNLRVRYPKGSATVRHHWHHQLTTSEAMAMATAVCEMSLLAAVMLPMQGSWPMLGSGEVDRSHAADAREERERQVTSRGWGHVKRQQKVLESTFDPRRKLWRHLYRQTTWDIEPCNDQSGKFIKCGQELQNMNTDFYNTSSSKVRCIILFRDLSVEVNALSANAQLRQVSRKRAPCAVARKQPLTTWTVTSARPMLCGLHGNVAMMHKSYCDRPLCSMSANRLSMGGQRERLTSFYYQRLEQQVLSSRV